MDNVQIYHPEIPHTKDKPAVVSRKGYDTVWREKGWRLHPPRETKKEK